MQDYNDDRKNLLYALQDLLYTIQKQPPGTVRFTPDNRDYMETSQYKNAVETHAHYSDTVLNNANVP